MRLLVVARWLMRCSLICYQRVGNGCVIGVVLVMGSPSFYSPGKTYIMRRERELHRLSTCFAYRVLSLILGIIYGSLISTQEPFWIQSQEWALGITRYGQSSSLQNSNNLMMHIGFHVFIFCFPCSNRLNKKIHLRKIKGYVCLKSLPFLNMLFFFHLFRENFRCGWMFSPRV